MTVLTRAVVVGDQAVPLSSSGSGDSRSDRSFAFYNASAVDVYIGGSGLVTVSSGVPVPAGTWSPGFELEAREEIWGVAGSDGHEVRVLEGGLP